ncbi:hypothetical protein [Phenylobacterium sp.]|uniref:hypothetical protein n=1 Tax=Phenylobacterium sp. TaxID=1871053 RepID=UPI00273765F5|nr:hypothetical protein [Phenylobacterium sp.]MDP3852457.1 hypothetical protein [Phenylobacterium sp.]
MPLNVVCDRPTIVLVESDGELRGRLAAGLRHDGMRVVEYEDGGPALAAIEQGLSADILVISPQGGGVVTYDMARQARALAPQIQIVVTPAPQETHDLPSEAHVLVKPFEPSRLSRYIRFVAAKPALRGALRAVYRQARSARPALTPLAH